MGMYCDVYAVTPDEVKRLASDPATTLRFGRSRAVSLEKSWHGLHYLLTGSVWEGELPLGFLLAGGAPVGDDLGNGPARLFLADEVRQIDAALSAVSDDQLWARFDANQMEEQEVYPGVWDEPEADLREEYVGYFQQLKQLVREARTDKLGLLVLIG
jgi:hypothetical protein